MFIRVAINCLVVIAVLGGVRGFPENQLFVEEQNETNDSSSIIQEDDLERQERTHYYKTKLACKVAGGKCQPKNVDCYAGNGELVEGNSYCIPLRKYACCIPPPPIGCVFGARAYPHNAFITDACLNLQCKNGIWTSPQYDINDECGHCSVNSNRYTTFMPHNITGELSNSYIYNGTGDYVITQRAFSPWYPDEFGVTARFGSLTYYELGLEIKTGFQSPEFGEYFGVIVNGQSVTIADSVNSFYATGGAVLLLTDRLPVVYIVGTKGLTIKLQNQVTDDGDLIFAKQIDVWTMPSPKYELRGLCDVFVNPPNPTCYSKPYGHGCVTDTDEFADSWKVYST